MARLNTFLSRFLYAAFAVALAIALTVGVYYAAAARDQQGLYEGRVIDLGNGDSVTLLKEEAYGKWLVEKSGPGGSWAYYSDEEDLREAMESASGREDTSR